MIAIAGCQRSGTTLTGQVLGAHPEAVLIDETDGLYPWFHAQSDEPARAGALAHELLRSARAKYREPGKRFERTEVGVRLSPAVSVLVLKAPNLTYDDDKLERLGLPVTVVWPLRDPRAVVASMDRLSEIDFVGNQVRLMGERPRITERYDSDLRTLQDRAKPPWVRRSTMWRVKSGRADDFESRGLDVKRFYYEDLVREPRAVIERIVADCGLAACDQVFEWHSAYAGFGPGGTDRTRAIDEASLSSWRSVLSPQQQCDVLEAAAPLAATHGYR